MILEQGSYTILIIGIHETEVFKLVFKNRYQNIGMLISLPNAKDTSKDFQFKNCFIKIE